MQAVILAGGKGTRLGGVTGSNPKPMAPIGGKPLLERQISLLKKYGIRDIILLTHHRSAVIENHFKDGREFGVRINVFREEKPLGSAGGLVEIKPRLKGDFIVLFGDVMADMALDKLRAFHEKNKSRCTLVLHPNDHPYDSDLVRIDHSGRVEALYPHPHPKAGYYRNLVNAGVYVMSPEIISMIPRGRASDFARDILPRLLGKFKVYGYVTAEYLKDIGTPERLEKVNGDFLSGKIARLNSENPRKAVFLDRDGVINREINLLHEISRFELLPGVPEAVKKINGSEYMAVVATNQPVVARGLCSLEELEEINRKMETLLGERGALLDAVYFCPHHPDKGYPGENPAFKIGCRCRKPGTGMVEKAARQFNIDLKRSFLIGDSERDMLCAKKAGIAAVAVGGGEMKTEPDFIFSGLPEAADFITTEPYEKYFQFCLEKYLGRGRKPLMAAIGGNSRSGKTTLANYLSLRFRQEGKKVLKISLDNWILPADRRENCHDVYGRFQLNALEKDLERIMSGGGIRAPKYSPLLRGWLEEKIFYKFSGEDIVIAEGVVALSSGYLREKADLKFFCETDEKTRGRRLKEFYAWKGLSPSGADRLIASRAADEYELIARDKAFADAVVS